MRRAGREIVDEDIGGGHQSAERIQPIGPGEVDAEALLPVIVGQEGAARSPPYQCAGGIAGWRFDLDHLRAELAQDMSCERRGNHRAEFDHATAGQGALAHETPSEDEANNALCIL